MTGETASQEPPSRTAAIRGNPCALDGDPDDIVHTDWSPPWAREA